MNQDDLHDDDDRSIRRIALRILNEDEDEAREELDNIVYGVEDSVQLRSAFYSWSLPVFIVFPALFWILATISWTFSRAVGNAFYFISGVSALIPLWIAWSWYRFQYGSGKIRGPREAVYGKASDESREKLEKLFTFMQRDSSPKAYYRPKKGLPRYLDYNHTFGSLRVLLFSRSKTVRELYLPPGRRRSAEVIKIDADPDAVIKALNVKPKRKGGPGIKAKYPYLDAILWLIDDPHLKSLDLTNEQPAVNTITKWLSEWFKTHADESGDIPRNDQLKPYAQKIYERQKKISSGR